MRARLTFGMASLVLLAVFGDAGAQYIYIDTTGDGINGPSDVLLPSGETEVSLYLDTCHDREGMIRPCRQASNRTRPGDLDLFSYNLILAVQQKSGSVRWGEYVDAVGFTLEEKDRGNSTELLVARRGTEALPPGRYLLGKITVTPLTGSPVLGIAQSSKLDPAAFTGFGTHCAGSEYPNTYVLGTDWGDIGSAMAPATISPEFVGVRISASSGNGSNRSIGFRVTLGSPAVVRIEVFDVSGRLVRTLADGSRMSAGTRDFVWDARGSSARPAASGIYFVRVDADGRKLARKFVLVK